jgi:dehydrogenase/reductase SDR family protein 12
MAALLSPVGKLIDRGMDFAVLPGYTKIGIGVRRQFWDEPAEAGVAGKRVLITGASAGLGAAAAAMFARGGADVHMLVRDRKKGQRVAAEIAASTGADAPAIEVCDVSSMAAVRAFAAEFTDRVKHLDVLVNNAGVMPPERTQTDEGIELGFATNVLGPFLLTNLLLPALRRSEEGRVINVSSGGMYTERLDPDDLQLEGRDYDPPAFYAHTKRCEVILTELWAVREPEASHVTFHSMHPGWADTPGVETSLPRFHKVVGPLLRDPADGADTAVWLGSADAASIGTGRFWHDRQARPTHRLPRTRETDTGRQALWQSCAELAAVD